LSTKELTLLGVGDMGLGRSENPEARFTIVAPVLKAADVAVGQVEGFYTDRPVLTAAKSGVADPIGRAQSGDPKNMAAFRYAGFNVLHLAGNHVWDAGVPAIEDTIKGLHDLGIPTFGAGMNIDEARKPAILERKGTKFGFLNYNCVGPRETWADPDKPGCAYVHVITAYELDHPTPGGPPAIYSFAEPTSLKAMVDDILKLRPLCDVLTVCFHKGIGFSPMKLAMYDHQVSYAAIDAGADLVLGEHAHILKGIEVYRGRAIFHGLGDFIGAPRVPGRSPMSPMPPWLAKQRERRMRDLWGFEPDPARPGYPGDAEAKNTVIAKCIITDKKISRVSYLPCIINENGQNEILKKSDPRGQHVYDYMQKISRGAELNTSFEWDGDEVLIKT
jgi:poly-gamma-glutamate synthesis protein (capsule biosynthesis protein)